MRLKGRIWKDGKYWVVHVPLLDISTQGTSEKNALAMIRDAIAVESDGLQVTATLTDEKGIFTVGTTEDTDALIAFMLKRLRLSRGLTLRDMAQRLHSSSPAAYAQYEKGRRSPSVRKLQELVSAVDPGMEPVLSM